MKVWAAKTVHLLGWVRNLDRYKRVILASLISVVLIISIIFVGSFLLTARSGSSDGYSYFEIFIDKTRMWNCTMHGPMWYNVTTDEGLITLQVTNITMDRATYSNMSLISGRNLTMEISSAKATKLVVYTTHLKAYFLDVELELYGNEAISSIEPMNTILDDVYMKVVYMQLESLNTTQLSLTI